MRHITAFFFFMTTLVGPVWSQQHGHEDHAVDSTVTKVEAPKVFLDKSPRIVAYQLKRLDNQRLLMVQRKTDDAKYIPVYDSILSRIGMSPQFRQEALKALVTLQKSNPVTVLMNAIGKLDAEDREENRTAKQLAVMLLGLNQAPLKEHSNILWEAIKVDDDLSPSIAAAALLMSNQSETDLGKLTGGQSGQLAFLKAITLIPDAKQRSPFRQRVLGLLDRSGNQQIKNAAITAIGSLTNNQAESFVLLGPLITDDSLRASTVRSMLKIPIKERDSETSMQVTRFLVDLAEKTPAAERTSPTFVDAMQLADQLMAIIPSDQARIFRQRLSAVTVRVVRIKTVEEEMRYDIPYFVVEAGKSVQIVLENHDLMPHNLVITVPEALKEVAQLGLQVGPNNGWNGMPYVPESDKVLHATQMVPSDQQITLTFDAPTEPGEYPYVCTFPQHWYRMYGVMVVVNDLDAWLKNPVEPANPIGSNRSFVQAWKVDELKDDLDSGMRDRSPEIGKRLFAEASCAGCHKVQGEGGVIGPELTDVFTRWKGDRVGVLREVLDPSHKVDAKYVMQRILTADGRTVTGVLLAEDDDKVTLLSNPEAKEPTVIAQDDIEAMVPSSVSMMPKALMDQYTKDELFEVMAYLESVAPASKP
ncbi:MAG: plastocyanin/azurin family copper-binding protein [Rubripirellula sp.]|nr:plastocyanin/azurin family copper-binding protein [Rubripirellula sp.]